MIRAALLVGFSGGRFDAVAGYTNHLAHALNQRNETCADVYMLEGPERWVNGAHGVLRRERYDVLGLQYNPFSFGRRGRALWLPRWWETAGCTKVVTIHEAYVPGLRPRELAVGVPQRLQLSLLRRGTDLVITTCGQRVVYLRGWDRRMPLVHIPVGSNIVHPRARLPIRMPGPPRLLSFGGTHPTRQIGHVVAAANAVVAACGRARLDYLGAGLPPPTGLDPRVELYAPGALEDAELAARFIEADLALLPYANGASSNRTTLASLLACGTPVLSTARRDTDSMLRAVGVRSLTRPSEAEFAAEAVRLIKAPDELCVMSADAYHLGEVYLSWHQIADRTAAAFELARCQ